MRFTIQQTHEGLTRTISVHVVADNGKQLVRVRTSYDGFIEDDDFLSPMLSSYETVVRKTQGFFPNRKHIVRVEAWHHDNTVDAGEKSWMD